MRLEEVCIWLESAESLPVAEQVLLCETMARAARRIAGLEKGEAEKAAERARKQSERMKAYWAKRRTKDALGADGTR